MAQGKLAYLLARAEMLQKQIEAEMGLVSKYNWLTQLRNGQIIKFQYKFEHGTHWYSYAAIKVADAWYTTGPNSPKNFSDGELIDWFERGHIRKVKVALSWKPLT